MALIGGTNWGGNHLRICGPAMRIHLYVVLATNLRLPAQSREILYNKQIHPPSCRSYPHADTQQPSHQRFTYPSPTPTKTHTTATRWVYSTKQGYTTRRREGTSTTYPPSQLVRSRQERHETERVDLIRAAPVIGGDEPDNKAHPTQP